MNENKMKKSHKVDHPKTNFKKIDKNEQDSNGFKNILKDFCTPDGIELIVVSIA